MLTALNEEVADGSLLNLVRRILASGVVEPSVSEVEPTEMGTPQGGPLSPLLANVYLHAFDVAMEQAGYGLSGQPLKIGRKVVNRVSVPAWSRQRAPTQPITQQICQDSPVARLGVVQEQMAQICRRGEIV